MLKKVHIGIVGDQNANWPPHRAIDEALGHGNSNAPRVWSWVATPAVENEASASLAEFDGLIIAPGSPYASLQGVLNAISYARKEKVPVLATCGGYQHVVMEWARNELGYRDAQHAEYDPYASDLIIERLACSLKGQRLDVYLRPNTLSQRLYGASTATEEYYCNFGLAPGWQERLAKGGLTIAGTDREGEARIIEWDEHPYFVATLFVPFLSSSRVRPHPLVSGLINTAEEFATRPKV